jgi:hypothetical protein
LPNEFTLITVHPFTLAQATGIGAALVVLVLLTT